MTAIWREPRKERVSKNQRLQLMRLQNVSEIKQEMGSTIPRSKWFGDVTGEQMVCV